MGNGRGRGNTAGGGSRGVPSTKYRMPRRECPLLGTRYLVLAPWYSVLGTWYLVLGTRYSVLGTWYSVLGTPTRSALPLHPGLEIPQGAAQAILAGNLWFPA